MHHQLTGTASGQRNGGLAAQIVITVAQAHLGRHRQGHRHRAPHRRHDGVQQIGFIEQHRAATVAVHRFGRTTEVQIDALGTQFGQTGGVVGQAGRVTAQQLRAHRRAGQGAAAVQQLRHHPDECPRRQQLIGDADELADAAVDAAHGCQHLAQRVVEQALHGREQNRHQPRSVEVRRLGCGGWQTSDNQVMKTPLRLQPLLDEGLIDSVQRQLMSGKEAMVFVVQSGGETVCAKVYKEANNRSFRQAVDYTENRKTKNSRQARAMAKGTKFGRQAMEAAWQSAEVDALYRLAAAGVRVPKPINFHEGVLLMELVCDASGDAAPRLNDMQFTSDEARTHHATLIKEVVRMLAAGVVHGDLSEFNILVGADGPVIIDLPQAVDAAGNNHAAAMLERDVANLRHYFGRFAPELLATDFGREIWALYEKGLLNADTMLTGRFTQTAKPVNLGEVLAVIDDARDEEAARRLRMQAPR